MFCDRVPCHLILLTFVKGALSKSDIEKLLRHGAYDVFKEEKEGKAEAESNEFVQQDIDTIMARRSRTIVHDNTGSQSSSAGGTFSKASFKVAKAPGDAGTVEEDVDVDDPEFWKKVLGEPKAKGDSAVNTLDKASRRRYPTNYNEARLLKDFDSKINYNENGEYASDSTDNSETEEQNEDGVERSRWGGTRSKNEWYREDVETLVRVLSRFGYGVLSWERLSQHLSLPEPISIVEVRSFYIRSALHSLVEASPDSTSDEENVVLCLSCGALGIVGRRDIKTGTIRRETRRAIGREWRFSQNHFFGA